MGCFVDLFCGALLVPKLVFVLICGLLVCCFCGFGLGWLLCVSFGGFDLCVISLTWRFSGCVVCVCSLLAG